MGAGLSLVSIQAVAIPSSIGRVKATRSAANDNKKTPVHAESLTKITRDSATNHVGGEASSKEQKSGHKRTVRICPMYRRECSTTPQKELTDTILVAQTYSGDHLAFETLVHRYHLPLYHFAGRCLGDYEQARDVLQFVFLQLYVSIPKLHGDPVSRRSKAPLKSWLFQVAWNRCMDELRKKRPILFSELGPLDEDEALSLIETIPDLQPLPEEIVEHNDLRAHLHSAIQSLPPRFRSVVLLRYTESLSFG